METIVEIFILEEHPGIFLIFFKPFIPYEQFQVIFFTFCSSSICSIYTEIFGKIYYKKMCVCACNCFFTCSLLKKPKM